MFSVLVLEFDDCSGLVTLARFDEFEPRHLGRADFDFLDGLEFRETTDKVAELFEVCRIVRALLHGPVALRLDEIHFSASRLDEHVGDVVEREIQNLASGPGPGIGPGI